ncbi:acyltransferase family protein [Nocardia yamanashiensis]|uniref:acyltransferase family protein n=1 Tax=Nocardia yamanashiensis TaxID=209247 RepID=UPI00082E05D5|nr:acyltransferase [Nocardia yamanashiensis]
MTSSDEAVADPSAAAEVKIKTRGGRFEFLDALRGLAALAVVIQHCSELAWPAYERFSANYFGAGVFGVFVFFIVSGFIIPASLERGRSLGGFWVGRFFRLYPLYWGCLIAALVLHLLGMYGGPPGWMANPAWNLVTNFSMAHFFITGHDSEMLVVAWTLSYELAFYLFVSLLFIGNLNRRSVPSALIALAAILPAGVFLPAALLSGPEATLATRVAVLITTVVVAVIFAARAATRRAALTAVVLSAIAIPLALNQPGPSWYSVAIFATMFTGTVVYRMTSGEISPRAGWSVFGLAIALIPILKIIQLNLLHQAVFEVSGGAWKDVITIGAAYLFFGAFLLLRGRSFPAPLLFLGRISYSLYLVHALVMNFVPRWPDFGPVTPWLTWATWIAVSIGLSALTYHKVEKPLHELGHRVIAKMEARRQPAAVRA